MRNETLLIVSDDVGSWAQLSYSETYAAVNAELRMQRWREATVILRGEVTALRARYGVQG